MKLIRLVYVFVDVDRASSTTTFGGGAVGGHQNLHGSSGNGNTSNFYSEPFGHQQHRHQVDDTGSLFSSSYPVPATSEPQHIRLQSPPHRLNHRNRNLHQNQQFETGKSQFLIYIITETPRLCFRPNEPQI